MAAHKKIIMTKDGKLIYSLHIHNDLFTVWFQSTRPCCKDLAISHWKRQQQQKRHTKKDPPPPPPPKKKKKKEEEDQVWTLSAQIAWESTINCIMFSPFWMQVFCFLFLCKILLLLILNTVELEPLWRSQETCKKYRLNFYVFKFFECDWLLFFV